MSDLKSTNPKDAIGSSKLPLHLWPTTATALGSLGLLDGALKYGRLNWREGGVRASIYVDALYRHVAKWFEGQDTDTDSGLPHLAHALACLAILVDAEAAGLLTDDRQFAGEHFADYLAELTPLVEKVKANHAARNPKHYTIADNTSSTESCGCTECACHTPRVVTASSIMASPDMAARLIPDSVAGLPSRMP